MLFLVDDEEGIVELAELMMDERVGGEAVLRQPWPMKPIAVEGPFEEARLHDGKRDTG